MHFNTVAIDIDPSEEHALPARPMGLRLHAGLCFLFVALSIWIPLVGQLFSMSASSLALDIAAVQVLQALSQTVTFSHPFALVLVNSAALSHGLVGYSLNLSAGMLIYSGMSLLTVVYQWKSIISEGMNIPMVASIIVFSLAIADLVLFNIHIYASPKFKRKDATFIKGFRGSMIAIRLFSLIPFVLFVVRILLCVLVEDDVCLGFGVVFRNQFFFIQFSSDFNQNFIIAGCSFWLLTVSFVPYIYTVTRLVIDKNFNSFDAISGLVYAFLVCIFQLGAFICQIIAQRQDPWNEPSAGLFLSISPILVLSGVMYIIWFIVFRKSLGQQPSNEGMPLLN